MDPQHKFTSPNCLSLKPESGTSSSPSTVNMFQQTIVSLILVATIGSTFAGQVNYTECANDDTFTMDYLDVQGCSGSSKCQIRAGQTYTVEFSGCYNGTETVSPINTIPYDVKAGFLNVNLLPVVSGDLCQNFTSDSATTSCPATVPQPDGACGKWLLNVKVPLFDLGILPGVGLPGTVQASAWANVKTGVPVVCVEFPIKYFIL